MITINIHPEPFDHFPMLSLLQGRNVNFASSLYVSKLKVKAGLDQHGNYSFNEFYDRGTGFQLNVNNVFGFHSSNSLDNVGEDLANLALNLSKKNSKNKNSVIDQSQLEEGLTSKNKLTIDISKEGHWSDNYKDEINSFLKDIEGLIIEHKNKMRFTLDIEAYFVQKRYQSTKSIDIQQEYSYSLLSVYVESKNHTYPIKRNEIMGGIIKSDFEWQKVENRIESMISQLEQLEVVSKPPSGEHNVLLSEDAVYSLIHETIGHGCEADQIVSNNSFLNNKMGFKVANSNLTIVDDPHIRNVGWGEYDDEGIKTQGTLLVDEGILSSFLHDTKTAKIMNQTSTGNARATSYLSPPEPRQSNIYIEPGDLSNEELLEEVRNGLLIGPTLAASTSIYTGEFSIESQISFEIKNGEIVNILGPVTITGNALESLNNITSIGNNPEMIPAVCLKGDSLVYVGSLMPQMALSKVRVY
ncbi:MAG: hypothetical protein HeimC2_24040 [Candidatus Heimdallarchaeota archaeon LC_2]|nr:MAG: hypothetical protein HeimC2_24040 [Candidatus Heimdallarchaeota archaeon LC_2]